MLCLAVFLVTLYRAGSLKAAPVIVSLAPIAAALAPHQAKRERGAKGPIVGVSAPPSTAARSRGSVSASGKGNVASEALMRAAAAVWSLPRAKVSAHLHWPVSLLVCWAARGVLPPGCSTCTQEQAWQCFSLQNDPRFSRNPFLANRKQFRP